MADNRRWFKVWTTIMTDPTFLSLSPEYLGYWVLLGAWLASHGDKGKIQTKYSVIANVIRCEKDAIKDVLDALPNIEIALLSNDNDSCIVSMKNWQKYQHDTTAYERLKKWRNDNDDKKRREEKRKTPYSPPKGDDKFNQFWLAYPRKIAKQTALKAWNRYPFSNGLFEEVMSALERHKQSADWQKDGGKFIPHPATWLNGRRWEDEVEVKKSWRDG